MKKNLKRIFAWVSIALLALLYISVLVLALMGYGFESNLFGFCLLGTIIIPIIVWVIVFLIDRYKKEG